MLKLITRLAIVKKLTMENLGCFYLGLHLALVSTPWKTRLENILDNNYGIERNTDITKLLLLKNDYLIYNIVWSSKLNNFITKLKSRLYLNYNFLKWNSYILFHWSIWILSTYWIYNNIKDDQVSALQR